MIDPIRREPSIQEVDIAALADELTNIKKITGHAKDREKLQAHGFDEDDCESHVTEEIQDEAAGDVTKLKALLDIEGRKKLKRDDTTAETYSPA